MRLRKERIGRFQQGTSGWNRVTQARVHKSAVWWCYQQWQQSSVVEWCRMQTDSYRSSSSFPWLITTHTFPIGVHSLSTPLVQGTVTHDVSPYPVWEPTAVSDLRGRCRSSRFPGNPRRADPASAGVLLPTAASGPFAWPQTGPAAHKPQTYSHPGSLKWEMHWREHYREH